MSNVYKALTSRGMSYAAHKGTFGLEIETETVEAYDVPKFSFWDVHRDGSLRNFGQEYVLKQPLDFNEHIPLALEEFRVKTSKIPFIKDSVTTSVHVHINFLGETFQTLGNFLTIYSLTENLLIRMSGADRLSNLFALPICDAETTFFNMKNMLDGIKAKQYNFMVFDPEHTKYAAINLAALSRFGSLEIRSFRGTVDTKEIHDWIGTLNQVFQYSKSDFTPDQFMDRYKKDNSDLLTNIFGPYREKIRHKNEESLIEQNVWYAASLAYSIKDWKKLDEPPKEKKKVKFNEIDKYSVAHYGRTFEALNEGDKRAVLEHLRLWGDANPFLGDERVENLDVPVGGLERNEIHFQQVRIPEPQNPPMVRRIDRIRIDEAPQPQMNAAELDNFLNRAFNNQPVPMDPFRLDVVVDGDDLRPDELNDDVDDGNF